MKFFREIRENSVYMKHEQDAGKREGRKERRGREDGEERNDRGREEGGKGREEMRGEREAWWCPRNSKIKTKIAKIRNLNGKASTQNEVTT